MTSESSTLLICTVGGTPDPIVNTLSHWKPIKVCFVPTPQTRKTIPSIVSAAKTAEFPLDAGRYDIHELSDGEDFALCLTELQRLTGDVEKWVQRGEDFRVVVDFTGGTKCMSAAVSLQASRWPCVFSYVGGAQRTKDGVGIVEPGHERVVHQANPWDALGYRAVEDYIVLFDQHTFLAAANIASVTMRRMGRPDRKRELAVLEQLAKALDAWDRFEHTTSKNLLESVTKSANDLRAVLGSVRGDRVLAGAGQLAEHLGRLGQAAPPSRHHVLDLLANATRRKDEGRFDDAVARLYRAIEAIAQVALKEGYGIGSTERVPLERVPESLRTTWASRANEGVVKLGLQDAYALLGALGDPRGANFQNAKLNGPKSALVARNHSILAHGFERVSDTVFDKLWTRALSLAGVEAANLPSFPTLAEAGGKT
ncbi:MAG TPA: TIGR02710 family CRISPR-associated CARF protein [Candidatus Krumholzibacteria bacterium]